MIFNFHTEIFSSPRGCLACGLNRDLVMIFLIEFVFATLCAKQSILFPLVCSVTSFCPLKFLYRQRWVFEVSIFFCWFVYLFLCEHYRFVLLLQWLYPWSYSLVAQMVKNLPAVKETWVWSLGHEDPLEKGIPTSVFLPGEFHGQRSQVGYSPWGRKEWLSD